MKMAGTASRKRFPSLRAVSGGSLLVTSLWVVATLSLFAVTAGSQVRQKVTLADRLDRRNLMYGLAEMGIEKALVELKEEDAAPEYDLLNDSWSIQPAAYRSVEIGGGTYTVFYEYADSRDDARKVRYGIQDEERKINLNTAGAPVISKLFQLAADLDQEEADEIAYGIVDWRD
jgi:type II secretory pathway component PulK